MTNLPDRLKRYSKKAISDALDPDFADAVWEAADVQSVEHGRWKWSEGGQCSECGFHNSNFGYNYCPNCGAKMDGEDNG